VEADTLILQRVDVEQALGVYGVYYAKAPEALACYWKPYCQDTNQVSRTHILVRQIEAGSLDDVFRIQQAHNWSPNGEQRGLIQSLGLEHTSMSVSDVVRDQDGIFWECRPIGWRRLGKISEPIKNGVGQSLA
jgi:hypothetical protein